MRRTKRYFVRHAESQYNAGLTGDYDSVITENGVRQATRTAQYLARSHSDQKLVGYVSPYRRALETARIIRRHTGIDFTVTPAVREWPLEVPPELRKIGCHRAEYPEFAWPVVAAEYDWTDLANDQYVHTLEYFVRNQMDANALVVSHQTTIEQMIFMAANVKELPSRRFYHIGNASVTLLENGSPTLLGHRIEE